MAAAMCCSASRGIAIEVVDEPSATSVTVSGELDVATRKRLLQVLDAVVERTARAGKARCRLDLSGVVYVDCASLRALSVVALHARRQGTDLVIVRPAPVVRRMLELAGYTSELLAIPTAT
jgi:anti-anti-sigma factor